MTKQDIVQLFTNWNAALQTGDPDQVTALYAMMPSCYLPFQIRCATIMLKSEITLLIFSVSNPKASLMKLTLGTWQKI